MFWDDFEFLNESYVLDEIEKPSKERVLFELVKDLLTSNFLEIVEMRMGHFGNDMISTANHPVVNYFDNGISIRTKDLQYTVADLDANETEIKKLDDSDEFALYQITFSNGNGCSIIKVKAESAEIFDKILEQIDNMSLLKIPEVNLAYPGSFKYLKDEKDHEWVLMRDFDGKSEYKVCLMKFQYIEPYLSKMGFRKWSEAYDVFDKIDSSNDIIEIE